MVVAAVEIHKIFRERKVRKKELQGKSLMECSDLKDNRKKNQKIKLEKELENGRVLHYRKQS